MGIPSKDHKMYMGQARNHYMRWVVRRQKNFGKTQAWCMRYDVVDMAMDELLAMLGNHEKIRGKGA